MKIAAPELAVLLVSHGSRRGPMYRHLADGLTTLIRHGDIPPGCQLPSERSLAPELNVSRTTVVAAYRHLQERGHVERRSGSGTRVTRGQGQRELKALSHASNQHVRLASQFLYSEAATVDFATVALPALPMVAETSSKITFDEFQRITDRRRSEEVRGLEELRAKVADHYTSQGLPTGPEEVLITSGAQHALEVIAEGCLDAGDSVAVEMPTYRGALEAFRHVEARVEGVRLDEKGINPKELERVLAARRPRLIFLQSDQHNPAGVSLSPNRRRQVITLAEKHGALIVDDRSLADTGFSDQPPALASIGDAAMVITIGSMNKLFWGGLRVGWIRAHASVISRLATMKGGTEVGASTLSQYIGVRLLDQMKTARDQRVEQLSHGYATMIQALSSALPDWSWWKPTGGPSLWVELPRGDASQFAALAMRAGVAVLPEAVFVTEGPGRTNRSIRLQYALPDVQINLGIERLAAAWASYQNRRVFEAGIPSAFN